ncbi:tRNA 2-selenouridine(34) synthase MnmH [Hydrogenimonas sp.]
MAELFDDFGDIVLNRRPLIDVRAPVEFEKGAFPGSVNLPLMSDEERHLVGIAYKEKGNAKAVELGHELVSGKVKEKRVEAWCDFKKSHPEALLYCFRGGQRSQISQRWMAEAGCEISRLKGGYKAFRNFLMQRTEEISAKMEPIVLGGRTGSGKTLLLKKLDHAIDLEGLANHRGSSFGRKITPQPSQIDFENRLAYDLIAQDAAGHKTMVFEDEGKNVGRLYLPPALFGRLNGAALVILETPMSKRVDITFYEYVEQAQKAYEKVYANDSFEVWQNDIASALQRIQKRLGGLRYKKVKEMFESACSQQKKGGGMQMHRVWVEYLLHEYYDPMYDYQIAKRADRVVFRGNEEDVKEFLSESGTN